MNLLDETTIIDAMSFTVFGRPQQRGSKTPWLPRRKDGSLVMKNGRPVIATMDDNKKSKDWMVIVGSAAVDALPPGWEPYKCPLRLVARFFFSRPQNHYGTGRNAGALKATAPQYHAQSPDLAKLVRCLEDALIGIVFVDDKLICEYDVQREWTANMERAEVLIIPLR